MKPIFTFLLLFLSVLSYSQSEKYFEYRLSKNASTTRDVLYNITPKFDSLPDKSKEGYFRPKSYNEAVYLRKFVSDVSSAVFKDKLKLLKHSESSDTKRTRAWISIYIDSDGNVIYMSLGLPKEDKKILTDELLYQFYNKLKATKFDMSRGVFEEIFGKPNPKHFVLVVPLCTMVFRGEAV